MIKKEIKHSAILLLSIMLLALFLTTTVLSGCKTTTTAETTTVETTSTETTAAETTAAATETTEATETTAAETTATETTATETTATNEVKFTNEKLILSGSTTLLEVSQLWTEAFMKQFGGEVTINGGGSGVGITDLINGTTDLANSSRSITDDEKTKAQSVGEDIKEYKVLIDGICIVTSKNINVSELTINQLSDIYTGKITNWNQVGGLDAQIVVIARDSSSGTGEYFLQKVVQLDGKAKSNDYNENDLRLQSNADVVNQIETNSNAIGYIGIGYLKDAGDKVNLIKVKISADSQAIAPTAETVANFSYPISRYCYIYANANKLSKIAQAYLDFVLSADGQNIAEQAGFVKVK
jgi:phosphate transport system substrate-binding protein